MTSVCAYNVGPRGRRAILRALTTLKPVKSADLTALFEASRLGLVTALRVRYPRRRIICRRTDVVAMLHRDTPRPRVEVIRHKAAWRGPHLGRRKQGRRWLLLVWDDHAILLVHRVTPIGNWIAWDTETDLIRAVCRRPDLPDQLAVIGDHNGTDERLEPVYADMCLRLLPVNAKVDHAAVRGYKGIGFRLGKRGSDHPAILWRLSRR